MNKKLQSLQTPNKMNKLSNTKQNDPLGKLGKIYQHYYFISICILLEFADKGSVLQVYYLDTLYYLCSLHTNVEIV